MLCSMGSRIWRRRLDVHDAHISKVIGMKAAVGDGVEEFEE